MTDRGPDGRFLKGSSPNPGGRPKSDLSITALIDEAVTADDWKEIITVLFKRAKRGDLKAIEMLLDRRFGKPVQQNNIAGADGGSIVFTIQERTAPLDAHE